MHDVWIVVGIILNIQQLMKANRQHFMKSTGILWTDAQVVGICFVSDYLILINLPDLTIHICSKSWTCHCHVTSNLYDFEVSYFIKCH